MMALSGVRNSWLMVARKRVLDASACSAAVRASSSACSCILRSVTSRITATTSASRRGLIERPATHLDPDEIGGDVVAADRIAADAELDAARFAAARGIRQRGEIGRTIGDMDAIEQAMAGSRATDVPSMASAAGEMNCTAPLRLMARNHVAHVARQQAIAVFLDIEQRYGGARQRFRAKRKPCGIEVAEATPNAIRTPRSAAFGSDAGNR